MLFAKIWLVVLLAAFIGFFAWTAYWAMGWWVFPAVLVSAVSIWAFEKFSNDI